ncbi:methyltransferase family protein [Nocardioides zeae]
MSATVRHTRAGARLRPPPLLLCAAAIAAQRLLAGPRRPVTRSRYAASLALTGAAVLLLAGSARSFRQHRTTVDPRTGAQPHVLVTDGPNAFTRNPMYVAMTAVLLAHAAQVGGPRSLIPPALFVAWIDRVQITGEEATLADTFGADFETYRRTVPRWLGPRPSGS